MSNHVNLVDLPALRDLAKDDCSYFYYDRERYSSREKEGGLRAAFGFLRAAAIALALTLLFSSFLLVAVCMVKLIPFVPMLWQYFVWLLSSVLGILFLSAAYRAVFPNTTADASQLMNALARLLGREKAGRLEAKDFSSAIPLVSLSEGRASLVHVRFASVFLSIALWLLVLKNLDFSSLKQVLMWNALLLLDSATLTIFNLIDRFGVGPNAPPLFVFLLQAFVLATAAANILSPIIVARRGHHHIVGNKIAARNYVRGLQRVCQVFDPDDTLTKNAMFVEIDVCDPAHPTTRVLTLADLEAAILQQGQAILTEARPYLLESGGFKPEFSEAVRKVMQG